MVYVLTLITQKSLLPFAFRRANGSMSRKDNGKEVREWVQSSFKLHRNIPTKSSKKRNCSNIISITSLHTSKSHVCSFSDQNEVLGQLSPLRTQRSVITTWPTQPLTSLYSFHKKQERVPRASSHLGQREQTCLHVKETSQVHSFVINSMTRSS